MLRWSSSRPYGSWTYLGIEESSIALPIRPTYTGTGIKKLQARYSGNPLLWLINSYTSCIWKSCSIIKTKPRGETVASGLQKHCYNLIQGVHHSKRSTDCWNNLRLSSIGVQLVPAVCSVAWIQSSVTIRMNWSGKALTWRNISQKKFQYSF